MKKLIIILVATILLAIIAFNIGRILGRKVFDGEGEHMENILEENPESEVSNGSTGVEDNEEEVNNEQTEGE